MKKNLPKQIEGTSFFVKVTKKEEKRKLFGLIDVTKTIFYGEVSHSKVFEGDKPWTLLTTCGASEEEVLLNAEKKLVEKLNEKGTVVYRTPNYVVRVHKEGFLAHYTGKQKHLIGISDTITGSMLNLIHQRKVM